MAKIEGLLWRMRMPAMFELEVVEALEAYKQRTGAPAAVIQANPGDLAQTGPLMIEGVRVEGEKMVPPSHVFVGRRLGDA